MGHPLFTGCKWFAWKIKDNPLICEREDLGNLVAGSEIWERSNLLKQLFITRSLSLVRLFVKAIC